MQEEKRDRWKWLFLLLLLLGIGMAAIGLFRLFTTPQSGEYQLMEHDLNAQRLPSGDTDSTDDVMIQVSQTVTVDMGDQLVTLYYANPESNQVGARVSLKIGDTLVAQSDLIEPGYYLEEIDGLLTDDLDYGEQDGTLVIDTYDLNTGERSMVNNEIDVTVTVVS